VFAARCAAAIVCLMSTALFPLCAVASCESGGTASYADVTAVTVYRYLLLQALPAPNFKVYVGRNDHGDISEPPPRPALFEAELQVIRKTGKLTRGLYSVGDGERLFKNVVAILQKYDFFSMHLTPAKGLHLDGPDDFVAASRCGVLYSVGSGQPADRNALGSMFREVDLSDPQYQRFTAMRDELQAAALSAAWRPLPAETPTPAP
jgi:hypothetical protein